MKAQFFNASGSISIIGFIAKLKLASDTNNFHEGVALFVLTFSVKDGLAMTLQSRMSAIAHVDTAVPLKNTSELVIRKKILRSYLEVNNSLLKSLQKTKR